MNSRTLISNILQKLVKVPLTFVVASTAIVVACLPQVGEALQFDRTAVAAGELWRLATAHLVHWNVEHLQWDLLMFVVLGAACEIRRRRRMWLCTATSTACVSILVLVFFPEIETYRGLSGVDTALFTLLAIDLMRDALKRQQPVMAVTIGALLVGFMAKTAYEAVTGHALFVDQTAAGFELLVWDHIVAAVVGAVIALSVGRRHLNVQGSFHRMPATSATSLWNCA
jgi:rhomboid family GlyGly-CTERM serine protease